MRKIFIYALLDPFTDEIRYVGRTNNPNQRLYEHHQVNRLKTRTHHNYWIKSLLKKEIRAKMKILEECDEINWSDRERYWIANTPNLTNTSEGGEGQSQRKKPHVYTSEVRKQIGKSVSALHVNGTYDNSYQIFSKKYQGKKKKASSSIYCGVFKTASNTWLSQLRHHSKIVYLGTYKTEIEAAAAYDKKALELFGSSATLNFSAKPSTI